MGLIVPDKQNQHRNNVVRNNGRKFDAWLWGSQILIQNSQNVDVYNNVVTVAADAGNGKCHRIIFFYMIIFLY